jgi:hypothetical protein
MAALAADLGLSRTLRTIVDKNEFHRRLTRAGEGARELAQEHVVESLPTRLRYTLPPFDDPRGSRGPQGTLKFFGGRFLGPEDLRLVSDGRAADLLWVDGRVAAWINVGVGFEDRRCQRDGGPSNWTGVSACWKGPANDGIRALCRSWCRTDSTAARGCRGLMALRFCVRPEWRGPTKDSLCRCHTLGRIVAPAVEHDP